jgi:hypothetical protein
VENDPSYDNWTRLFLLSKCILASPVRSGKAHWKDNERLVKDRIRRWRNGNITGLWLEAVARFPRKVSSKTGKQDLKEDPQRINRVLRFIQEGNYSKAVKALTSDGIAAVGVDTIAEMRSKHPCATPPSLPPQPPPPGLIFAPSQVVSALNSFPLGTAPGCSQLRVSHLKNAVSTKSAARNEKAASCLTSLVNLFARGDCPDPVRPFLCGAALFAINKKQGGFRPIAVGEVIRRLVAKCFAFHLAPHAAELLAPLQVGVGVKGGCEGLVHAVTFLVNDASTPPESKCGAFFDFINAFNSIDREKMLTEVRLHFPSVSAWAECCYGSPSFLFMDNSTMIMSECGVQQGDPLGPLFFSLALHPLVESIRDACPKLLLNSWFLDDGTVFGPPSEVRKALDIVQHDGPARGMFLNLKKTTIWGGSLDGISSDSDPMFSEFPSDVRKINHCGFELLGAPIGCPQFCEDVFNIRINKITEIFSRLGDVNDSQAEFVLLRSCLSLPRLSYSLRTCAPQHIRESIQRFDDLQMQALSGIVGHPLDSRSWDQASLPVNLGGMGVKAATKHAAVSFVSSVHTSSALVEKILGRAFDPNDSPDFTGALGELRLVAGRDYWQTSADIDVPVSQRSLSRIVDLLSQRNLVESCPDDRDRARLSSVLDPHAGDWLRVVPSPSLGLSLHPQDFRFASLYRLGLPLYPDASSCSSCQRFNDVFGDHAVGCGGDRDRIARHDRIRDAVFAAAHSAALAPRKEMPSLIPGSISRPADVFIPSWSAGKAAAVDVTVVSPLQSSMLRDSAITPGFAVEAADRRKRLAYEGRLGADLDLIPLAVDTFGRFSDTSITFLSRLGSFLSLRQSGSAGHLFQRISVLLQKGNAALWGRRLSCAAPYISGQL